MWPFKSKHRQEAPVQVTIGSIKPSECFIESVYNETFYGVIPYQYVNWAAEQLSLEKTYTFNSPMSPKSMWVLYEACKRYQEEMKDG